MPEDKSKAQDNANTPDNTADASAGYQTTLEEENRKTGVGVYTDLKSTVEPEAPENDSVVGSPNQGTESR